MTTKTEKHPKFPEATPLDCVVLSRLFNSEASSDELKVIFARHGVVRTKPAFYEHIKRMEERGVIKSAEARPVDKDGGSAMRKFYRITPTGRKSYHEAKAFYEALFMER